jgi:hypothetical protein
LLALKSPGSRNGIGFSHKNSSFIIRWIEVHGRSLFLSDLAVSGCLEQHGINMATCGEDDSHMALHRRRVFQVSALSVDINYLILLGIYLMN